jgi:hypothetical protein
MTDALRRTAWLPHLAVALLLAGFVALLYWPLLFTNRVLATGDILLYFYPYRDFAAEALREGRIPFWNPYLFSGAPLLANTQAAVLYPLHWPLIWLPVTAQVYWSAALHTWLFGYGGYWLLRRWGFGMGPALVTALVLAGSGLIGGLIGHLNQLNVAAWLPWAVLCLPAFPLSPPHPLTLRAAWPRILRSGALLGLVVALMLLAGHTQTFYISLFALGFWAIWPGVAEIAASLRTKDNERRRSLGIPHSAFRIPALRLLIYLLGVLLGALIAAPQLLPTLELNGLGLRSGGLSYLDATSFSLKPLQLLWTLLPSYGLAEMSAVFDTPAYTEYIAYIGLLGLALAIVGAWRGRGEVRQFGLLFAGLGLLLALGRWNPLYFVLYTVVPGFDLFRVPARWMLIFTLGVGILAGAGAARGELRGARLRRDLSRTGEGRPLTIDHQQSTISNSPSTSPWTPVLLALLVAAELLLAARALPPHPADRAPGRLRSAHRARAPAHRPGAHALPRCSRPLPGDEHDHLRSRRHGRLSPHFSRHRRPDASHFRRFGHCPEGAGTARTQPALALAHPGAGWFRRRAAALAALQPAGPTADAGRPARARRPSARADPHRAGHRPSSTASTCSTSSPTKCAISGSRMSTTTAKSALGSAHHLHNSQFTIHNSQFHLSPSPRPSPSTPPTWT